VLALSAHAPIVPVSPVPPSPSLVAEAAVAYRWRRRFLVRLARVEHALERWDIWETNALLLEDARRPTTPPVLTREALHGLQQMLTEELARLDGTGSLT
jgi:hypothetical protein